MSAQSTSSRPRSVGRSLQDLGRLVGPTRRQRKYAEYVKREQRTFDDSPWVPCAVCGINMRYSQAVPRVIDAAAGFAGFTHPVGQCDEQSARLWQARVATMAAGTVVAEQLRARQARNDRAAK